MTSDEHAGAGTPPQGRPPAPDSPTDADIRPPRHLRVGVVLRRRSAAIGPIWVVDQAAMQRPTLADPILVRVDVGGTIAAVETHPDPRRSRGVMREGVGHSFGVSDEGTLFVSVPFASIADLAGVRIRLTDVTGVRFPQRQAETLAPAFDEPLPGMRAVHELGSADLRSAPDWPGVARQLGMPADAGTFEIYIDRAGKFRWRLRRNDGQIVADSGQGYRSRSDCESDLLWIRTHAATAPSVALDITARQVDDSTD